MRSLVRFLLKLAAWVLSVAAFLALLSSGLIYWVVKYPQQAWSVIEHNLLPDDLNVTWQSIAFKPSKRTWLHWDVDWQVLGLRIDKGSPSVAFLIDEIALKFTFSVFQPATRIDFADVRVIAESQPLMLKLTEDTTDEPDAPLSPFQRVKQVTDYLALANSYGTMKSFKVSVRELRVERPGAEPVAVALAIDKPTDGQPEAFKAVLRAEGKDVNAAIEGMMYPARFNTADPVLTLKLNVNSQGVGISGDVAAIFLEERLRFTYKGPVTYKLKDSQLQLDPELGVALAERQMDLRLTTAVRGIPGPLVKLDRVEAVVRMPMQNDVTWPDQPTAFNVSGPVDLFFIDKDMRPPLETSCKCRIPERLGIKLEGQVWMKALIEKAAYRKQVADVQMSVESLKNRLFSMNLAASAKIHKEADALVYEPALNSDVMIHSYQGVRAFLDAKNVIIPAPFDVLEGTISLSAKSPVSRTGEGDKTLVDLRADLGSENQKVVFTSKMNLILDRQLKGLDVFIRMLIQDFQVELPPLDPVAGFPALSKDPRVVMQEEKPAPPAPSKFPVRVYFELETARAGAICLLSKYAKPHVPITADVDRALNGDLGGYVKVEPFEIQYLRRTVSVEQMRVVLDNREGTDFPVDGRFRVDQTQYRIFVDVSGTLRSPLFSMHSEPELPRSEIISVLLFDRRSDQLVGGDAETAGNFEAAMADRAIGLFGLWAFASTPIRSFSYNAVTKVYTATVQLSDSVTASVGTNWEEAAHLELRKRVSRRWVLTASWAPGEAQAQIGRLVLQWERRF